MRPLLALVLVLALLSPPTAAQNTWSVDARVLVQEEGHAIYTWSIAGLTNTNLQLPLPNMSALIDARDTEGNPVEATNSTLPNGKPAITIGIRSRPATVRFELQPSPDGPYLLFPAQVAANENSPVLVGITLPPGWRLAGYRENDDTPPDATGTFRLKGPSYVQYLVTKPSTPATPSDPRVRGDVVMREGYANLTPSGGTWTLITTYDTDVFGRDWEVALPEGGQVVRASTPLGPLATTPSKDGVKLRTPYPFGFGLGALPFTVEMTLPTPASHGGAFRLSNLSIRAAEGDVVTLHAQLASGSQYAGARVSEGTREATPLRYEAKGPLTVGVAYLPPAAAGHVQFSHAGFIVDAPARLEAAARATVTNASGLLDRVASFARDPADTRPFLVAYSEDTSLFAWEEGFYTNGLNTITIRASTLENATDGKPHVEPVGVLLHETLHGLMDRRLPDVPNELSFLHEGLARLVETRAEAYFPVYPEIVQCTNTSKESRCDRHTARPAAETLHERYRNGARFDATWTASKATDGERGTLYDLSGLVFHAYTQRAPSGALQNVLAHLARTNWTQDTQANAKTLTRILLDNAPGTTESALLEPGREAAHLPIEEFRFCLGVLAAPAYPWDVEKTRAPAAGCPPTGYGDSQAALPPPPTPGASPPTPASTPAPTPTPTRVVPVPPTTQDPAPVSPTGATPEPTRSIPGAIADPTPPPPGGDVNINIPLAPWAAIAALAIAILFARRR